MANDTMVWGHVTIIGSFESSTMLWIGAKAIVNFDGTRIEVDGE